MWCLECNTFRVAQCSCPLVRAAKRCAPCLVRITRSPTVNASLTTDSRFIALDQAVEKQNKGKWACRRKGSTVCCVTVQRRQGNVTPVPPLAVVMHNEQYWCACSPRPGCCRGLARVRPPYRLV